MATASDLARLFELLLQMHAGSRYAGDVDVDKQVARSLLMTAVMRNGHTNEGGTICLVVEKAGKVEGFMLGILNRVYQIGNRLEATDLFLCVTPEAPRGAASKLIDGYVEWALDNPKVAAVKLSYTDAIAGAAKISKLYERKGFRPVGGIFEREAA